MDDLFKSEDVGAETVMPLQDWLKNCKTNPMYYATATERMLKAIGEPKLVETSRDDRLSRIFQNRTIKIFPAFADEFFGIEETIEQVVAFFQQAAQGLEERKQILYFLGPVGAAKSSLAEKLKELMQKYPIYVLRYNGQRSPVLESPLGLFNKAKHGATLEERYGIPRRYLGTILSPWAVKRLKESGGDLNKFEVEELYPSKIFQRAICKTEPGDDNNQDISSLVGKVDIRKLEHFAQNDPDAYSFSGGLCLANQGLLEFVEMFKAPIKTLHPLLTATQEGNYNGIEGAPIPFSGVIVAHSNEQEWQTFKGNRANEAFLDRVLVVKVPYCKRKDEEVQIYRKYLRDSALWQAPCAPGTLEMLAEYAILTRLKDVDHSTKYSKMRVYNGEDIKDIDTKAKSAQEYRELAGVDEGMSGYSTRSSFKLLSKLYHFDPEEVAANPIHLMTLIIKDIEQQQYKPDALAEEHKALVKTLRDKYAEFIEKEIKTAALESYQDFGQNKFDSYIEWAQAWLKETEYHDVTTGQSLDREAIDNELAKIEKPAGIGNPREFRQEIVMFCLESRAKLNGKNPKWTSYFKMKEVIEKQIFAVTDDIIPIITFNSKGSSEDLKKHEGWVARMMDKGYTARQTRLVADWWRRYKKTSN